MQTGPNYINAWTDLRRRELLFRFVALSFVPLIFLTIAVVNALYGDLPQQFGRWVGGGWIAAFLVAGLYRRWFRCPRCSARFFAHGASLVAERCANCRLPAYAEGDRT